MNTSYIIPTPRQYALMTAKSPSVLLDNSAAPPPPLNVFPLVAGGIAWGVLSQRMENPQTAMLLAGLVTLFAYVQTTPTQQKGYAYTGSQHAVGRIY